MWSGKLCFYYYWVLFLNEAALPCLGVKDAWDGLKANVLLSKIGLYKVFYCDIARTAPGLELESEVKYIFCEI